MRCNFLKFSNIDVVCFWRGVMLLFEGPSYFQKKKKKKGVMYVLNATFKKSETVMTIFSGN